MNTIRNTLLGMLALIMVVSSVAHASRLTSQPPPRYGAISMPAWSPDGSKVAFVYSLGGDSEIYVVDADGTNLMNVSHNPELDYDPVWNPMGGELIFTSRRGNQFDLYKVDVSQGRGARPKAVMTTREDETWPAWRPDGKEIAFCSYKNGIQQVFTLDMTDEDAEPELFFEERACFPAYSADMKRMAISSLGDLLIFKIGSDKNKNITRPLIEGNMVDDTVPVWAPRGSRLAFIGTFEAFSSEIYTISAAGKKIRRITDDMFENFRPQWSPDGKGVVYSAFIDKRPPEIFISDPESPDKDRITDNHSVEMSPIFSLPDGERILYVVRRESNVQDELYIMNRDGTDPQPFLKEKLPGFNSLRQ